MKFASFLSPHPLWFLPALCLSFLFIGCEPVAEIGTAEAQIVEDFINLKISTQWNTGGDAVETEHPDIVEIDDSEYEAKQSIALGPLSDCLLPANKRAETTVCKWAGPSDVWETTLVLVEKNDALWVKVNSYFGDDDSSFSLQMPLESLALAVSSPVSAKFEADKASGMYGWSKISILRVGDSDE